MIYSVDYLYGQEGSKRFNKHNIIGEPHPNSLAGYILMKEMLRSRDNSRRRIPQEMRIWLTFRNKFLRRVRKKEGDLVCFFCGKTNLHANHNSYNATKGHKATIDHYQPLSKGGLKFTESNLKVCCDTCNGKKADVSPEDFKSHKKVA